MSNYQAPSNLLQDRTILVTGAGEGIGRAAALAYARAGAQLILLGKRVNLLENVYDEIEQAGGPTPAIYPLDLEGANADHYSELAQRIESELGRLDGILHNAAELGVLAPLEHYQPALWGKVMMINLNGPALLTQACLPLLKKGPDSRLIFTTDKMGPKGHAYWGAYGVSKAAIENLAQMLAEELENYPVRVNLINPGPVRTKLRRKAYPGEEAEQHPTPDQVMPLYLYLMGPDSRDVHGQRLNAQEWMGNTR